MWINTAHHHHAYNDGFYRTQYWFSLKMFSFEGLMLEPFIKGCKEYAIYRVTLEYLVTYLFINRDLTFNERDRLSYP